MLRQIDTDKLQNNMFEQYLLAKYQLQIDKMVHDNQPTEINQNITINADFPDATDRDEIKAAFDNLLNIASQRAMTKKY